MADLREDISAKLSEHVTAEQLDVMMTQVLAITKQGRGWCPDCKKQVWVEIPDAKAVVSAMGELLNQSHGRPEVVRSEAEGVVFKRTVVYGSEEGVDDGQVEV